MRLIQLGPVAIYDDALTATCFTRLRNRIYRTGDLENTFDRTFWFGFSEPPDNVVALAILELHRLLNHGRRIIGAEWWLSRMRTSHVPFAFHQDRDGWHRVRTGKILHPVLSSVLFLNRCRGGSLAISERAPDEANRAAAPDGELWLACPRSNRFAVFPGNLTHGVLDSHNEIPGARRRRETRLRLAVAINFWHRRPERIEAFSGSSHYPVLAMGKRVAELRAP